MSEPLPQDELKPFAKKIPEWDINDKSISRTFEFDEYMEGIDFVDGVAEIAEDANHHPDIDVRWCKVIVTLTTHSAGGLTEADFQLAEKIDTLVE